MRLAAASLFTVLTLTADASTLVVGAGSNIFGAGRHTTPPAPAGFGAGNLPSSFAFEAAPGQILVFSSVTGEASLTEGFGVMNGPDGNTTYASDIGAFDGISGIRADAAGYLVGVFLGMSEPTSLAPPTLDFTSSGLGASFLTLAPDIGQLFFVGDGLTGTGSGKIQQFMIPAAASRLYLGFADAYGYVGLPGAYYDNVGGFVARFQVVSEVPEPNTWPAFVIGAVVAYTSRRRERSGRQSTISSRGCASRQRACEGVQVGDSRKNGFETLNRSGTARKRRTNS